jgi:hypothetical protein
VSLLLLLSAQGLAAWALLFATVAVTASDQFLSFDYIGPMSGTLGEASRFTSSEELHSAAQRDLEESLRRLRTDHLDLWQMQ